MPRLRRVDCSEPGIRRVRRGRGFSFKEEDGTIVEDAETLARINELAIPPAWKEVWICPFPNGHIQATGLDDAGRKQYRYHDVWRAKKDREKHEEMLDFGRRLPAMREKVDQDLALRGLVRDRVLACSVRLLDRGFFRVGTEQYSNPANESFGLATLRKRHVSFKRGHVIFDYKAKGSKPHLQELADPEVIKVLKPLAQRKGGGHELLAYREGRSGWRDIKSSDINEYLKEVMGGNFSAKDFRTWNATVIAAVGLAQDEAEAATSKTARKRVSNRVVKTVATYLNNTPAVCKASYIDPRVFDRFDSGITIKAALEREISETEPGDFPDRHAIEAAVLDLLS
jgi:DNA topoisomerase IB